MRSLVERGEVQVDHRKVYTIASKDSRPKKDKITEKNSQSKERSKEKRRDRDRDNRSKKVLITEGFTKAVIKRDGRIWKVYPFDKNIEPQTVRFKDVRKAKEGALVFYSMEEEGGKEYAKLKFKWSVLQTLARLQITF